MLRLVCKKLVAFTESGFWACMRLIFLGLVTIVFLATALHTPVEIHADASYDDALYIKLGESIARGHWLGGYDQLTLIKGPGYPLFLALNALLGLPITLSTALLHAGSIAAFFAIFNRLLARPNIAALGYAVTLWVPATFLFRLARNGIYPAQTLLVIAGFCWLLFGAERGRRKTLLGCLVGFLAGWMAITREEGVWLLPGLLVLAGYAGYLQWQKGEWRAGFVYPVLCVLALFLFVQGLVLQLNKNHYGRRVIVEVNSSPFKDALGALQSVDAGSSADHLPVPKAARMAVYRVSPSFRSLENYFDGPNGSPFEQVSCQIYPATCGDIAGGWFLWALRSAVSSQGHYQSARSAAKFYLQLATEIRAACNSGKLHCTKTLTSLTPHISASEWTHLPASLWSGIRQISFAQPSFVMPPSSGGSSELLAADVGFLGRPTRTFSPFDQQLFEIAGWYHSPEHAWITGRLTEDGDAVSINRLDSPDLVSAFRDSGASHERFRSVVACPKQCEFEIRDENGHSARLNLTEMSGAHASFALGDASLNVESVYAIPQSFYPEDKYSGAALSVRVAVAAGFSLIFPWLATASLIMFCAATGLILRQRKMTLGYVLALAIWTLLVCRLLLLGLIDISSFPGMIPDYLAPAYFLMAVAFFLSLTTFIEGWNMRGRGYLLTQEHS